MCDKMSMRRSTRQQPNKSFKVLKLSFYLFVETSKKRATLRRRPRRRPRRRVEWRWSSSTSALPAANVLRPYQTHAMFHTSCYVWFLYLNKSFQSSLSSHFQHYNYSNYQPIGPMRAPYLCVIGCNYSPLIKDCPLADCGNNNFSSNMSLKVGIFVHISSCFVMLMFDYVMMVWRGAQRPPIWQITKSNM